jgi:hypothetical protein
MRQTAVLVPRIAVAMCQPRDHQRRKQIHRLATRSLGAPDPSSIGGSETFCVSMAYEPDCGCPRKPMDAVGSGPRWRATSRPTRQRALSLSATRALNNSCQATAAYP